MDQNHVSRVITCVNPAFVGFDQFFARIFFNFSHANLHKFACSITHSLITGVLVGSGGTSGVKVGREKKVHEA